MNKRSNVSNEGSRSISEKRRLTHSPVSVNTAYELGHRNTERLWREFNTNLRHSESGSNKRQSTSKIYSTG